MRIPNETSLRLTHLSLYRLIWAVAITNLFLAANFWASDPTFIPYNLDKNWIGIAFFMVGLFQLIAVRVTHSLSLTRYGLWASIFINAFWGIANTEQFFDGNASLQLPIWYLFGAVVQGIILLALPVKPTEDST